MKLHFDIGAAVDKAFQYLSTTWSWITGMIMSVVTYFIDVKASFHVLWLAALFHIGLGILKSYRVQSEKFSIRKFADAVLVCAVFTGFLMLVHFNDTANSQGFISTFRIATWIITGAYIWHSIIISSTIWPRSPIFKIVIEAYRKYFKSKTGIDLPKEEEV